ncbi:MAG: 50S ribosomal protein L3, partial [candidate division Zixibacteria bacterium]|nr:50S ribosomal protein L3 [candidate division Zixibacteria bacterium]
MNTLLGRKLGMTRIYREDGTMVPVTVFEAGPCRIVAVRTKEKHGYNAYQVGFGTKRAVLINKPETGHF